MSTTEEIKTRLDIVEVISSYLRLQKAGRNWRALCPFHNEKSPSFMVSQERQIWHCFGCGESGDIFSFIMKLEGVEFKDALAQLAERAGVRLEKFNPVNQGSRQKIYKISELAAKSFQDNLSGPQGDAANSYLLSRALQPKTIKEFRIGYSLNSWDSLINYLKNKGVTPKDLFGAGLAVKRDFNNAALGSKEEYNEDKEYYDRFRNRIMFPILDIAGRIVGFSARVMPGEDDKMGKYINTPETLVYNKSKIIYGLDKAKLSIRKRNFCILMEGQLDVIMSHQAGVKNAVATSGTALTLDHLAIIKRYTKNLALCFDSDEAGVSATKRAIDLSIAAGFTTKVIIISHGKDPAEIIKQNPKLWAEAIKDKKPTIAFYFDKVLGRYDVNNVDDKKRISEELLPVIKLIPNRIEKSYYLQELARRIKVDEKDLEILLRETKDAYVAPTSYKKKNNPLRKNNSRREQLEELILGILLLYPENIKSIIENINPQWFSPTYEQILKDLKQISSEENGFNLNKILERYDESLRKDLNLVMFKTQQGVDERGLKPERAIQDGIYELEKVCKKDRRDQLALEIKEAEANKDIERLKILTEEFNKISRIN